MATPDAKHDVNWGVSCNQAGECAKACGGAACIVACLAKVCPSGASLVQDLITCATLSCSGCLAQYDTQCETCLMTSCGSQYNACATHTC